MLKPWKTTYDHTEIFIQRHDWLFNWALQLTGHQKEQAEDLLHDAFVHFTLSQPDLDAIQNLEGYLYVMLKNMHLSQVRRMARIQNRTLSIVDYDSAEIGLRTADPYERFQARDELRAVCHYACVRKETSKAGSVLILRFFHGYYPGEIAQILRSPRRAADDWLRIARHEARLYLAAPNRLSRFEEPAEAKAPAQTDNLLNELRHTIFQTRRGKCLSKGRLRELYSTDESAAIDCPTLAHIASCPDCLDQVNKLLGIPPLSDRYPTDMIGPDTPAKGPSRIAKPGATANNRNIKSFRRRASDVFEHSPKELRIAVNGFILGSQSLGSEFNEQTLSVSIPERIGFVEIFSEQEIRLLFLNAEPPPDGPVEQPAFIALSDGRTLELILSFRTEWPNLQVIYHDPTFSPVLELASQSLIEALHVIELPAPQPEAEKESPARRLRPQIEQWFVGLGSWFNPRTITAVLALLLIVVLLLVPRHLPLASAAELLRRSTRSEEAMAAKPNLITHRVLNFEERNPASGVPTVKRRIEIWAGAAKGQQARRVYDEKNHLVAGEWTTDDGTQVVYRRAAAHPFQRAAEQSLDERLMANNIWQLEMSAKDFSSIIGSAREASVSERNEAYIISYEQPSVPASRLRSAVLTLSKADLHPIEERLLVEQDGTEVEYQFAEQGFERMPVNKVAPAVFEIDRELLGRAARPSAIPDIGMLSPLIPPTTMGQPLSAAQLASLKVDVLYQLHQIGSCIRERANLTQSPDGGLRIEAVVETEKRKGEVLNALSGLTKTPSVTVAVYTVAEALRQQQAVPQGPHITRRIEITKDQIPAYADLRRYFSEQAAREVSVTGNASPNERVDEMIRRFASRMLNRSQQVLLQAWALKHHNEEMVGMDLGALDSQARARWHAMMSEHAVLLKQEISRLRAELQPIFFSSDAGDAANDEGAISSATDMEQTIEQLFNLASANEAAIRSAFAVSAENSAAFSIKTEAFRRSLLKAEKLAGRIQ